MEEEKGSQESTKTAAPGDPHQVEARRGPGWRGWALSILVAIALSVMATLLLGGSVSFTPEKVAASGTSGSGCGSGSGSGCCPPADPGK